jgi:AcrR family transcriptional regulator
VTQPSRASIGAKRNPATETAVLAAAQDILAEGGIQALTMEAVAKRARASKATLYRWWPSRARLLLAVYSASKDSLPTPDTGSLHGDLVAYVGAMLRHWSEMPEGRVLRHLIAEAQSEPAVMEALKAQRAARWHHIRQLLDRAAARGELAPGLDVAACETRIAALAWFWLLTDTIPTPADLPTEIDQLLAPVLAPAG